MKKIVIILSAFLLIGLLVLIIYPDRSTTKNSSMTTQTPKVTMQKKQQEQVYVVTATPKVAKKEKKDVEKEMEDSQGLRYRYVRDDIWNRIVENKLVVYAGKLKTKNVIIPDTFKGKKVTEIDDKGFRGCKNLESITIGKNVWAIGSAGFGGCENLSLIRFKGNKLTSIGTDVFAGCQSLRKINIPKSVRYIGECAFQNSGLVKIKIPNKVENLYVYTFAGCRELTKISFGKKLQTIKRRCFENCTGLKNIVLPEKLVDVEGEAFKGCKNLQEVKFKGAPYSMSEDAFKGTPFEKKHRYKGDYYILGGVILETYKKVTGDLTITNKTKINGQKIKGIGGTSYSGNKKIGKLIIQDIRGIGGEAFGRIKTDFIWIQDVEEVNLYTFEDIKTSEIRLKNVKKLDQCFSGIKAKKMYASGIGIEVYVCCSDNAEKIIFRNIKNDGGRSTAYSKKLKELVITGNIEKIYSDYFAGCISLESYTLESTRDVEYNWVKGELNPWFRDCKKLKDVYLKVPNVSATVEGVFPEWVTLHVPAEQVEEYQKYVTCKVVAW